jgi:hypothetical protein
MGKSISGFIILFVHTFLLISAIRASTDTLTPGQSIRDGDLLVSADGSFELGFFSPGISKGRYLGIWYQKISAGTVVWVANRETPLNDSSGALIVTDQGILILLNSSKDAIWSSNASRTAQNPVMKLLDSGNLVVKDINDNSENFLWQSFDYPGDTLLPGMKWGRNMVTGLDRYLSSWKSSNDPAQGEFTFRIDPRGNTQMLLMRGPKILYRTGTWNGYRWTGTPQLEPNMLYTYGFISTATEMYYKFDLINSSVASRIVMNSSGAAQRFTWITRTNSWARFSAVLLDQCDDYALCGAYGSCNVNKQPVCACLEGFIPKSPKDWSIQEWSDGCVRRTKLDCDKGDRFLQHGGVKLPDMIKSWVDTSKGLKECKDLCLKNCSCVAYANSDIRGGGSGCLLWFDELTDTRELTTGGQDLYIRIAASELCTSSSSASALLYFYYFLFHSHFHNMF